MTLSRETLDGILNDNSYFGSTVGRVANRVANAVFKVDDKVGCPCLVIDHVHWAPSPLLPSQFEHLCCPSDAGASRQEYKLEANNGPNHLHGGPKGLDKVVWTAQVLPAGEEGKERVGVRFSYVSPDGDEGYPGELHVQVGHMRRMGEERGDGGQGGSRVVVLADLADRGARCVDPFREIEREGG